MKIRHSEPYQNRRREEYPPIADQLDALVKMANALRAQGWEMPSEVHNWIDACMAVKDKYRKPAE